MKNAVPRVVVVGSFNMDLVVRAPRRPQKGETLFGSEFGMFPGGKGFNQAIAAARLGAQVSMIGRVGTDVFGEMFLRALQDDGIRAEAVTQDAEAGTGVGMPVIAEDGDNSIIVVPRANMSLTAADVERAAAQIEQADVLLLQLEVPQDASLAAARIAHEARTQVILNPAPASPLDEAFYALIDLLVPNEQETAALSGIAPHDDGSLRQAAQTLLNRGASAVVLTLGARGAYLAIADTHELVQGFRVRAVDTTGAGDAFCGALAVARARGASLDQAIRFANATAALSVTKLGASPSMPRAEDVERFLATVSD